MEEGLLSLLRWRELKLEEVEIRDILNTWDTNRIVLKLIMNAQKF
jgi:hypothetical protein